MMAYVRGAKRSGWLGPLAMGVVLSACGEAATEPTGNDTDGEPLDYRAELLRELTFERDERSFPAQLVRVHRPDGGRTYVHWIRSDRPGKRPAVLATDPYSGIDWSEEELDLRWAARGDGLFPDEDGPSEREVQVTYQLLGPEQAHDQEYVHLLNDFSVLRVHGRFYAGGSVADEIEDMKAGMWFLAEQPEVDPTKVGTFGGSWGGFESLYASAYGDRRVAPAVTVALYPPVDFASWLDFAHTRDEPVYGALEGHRARVEATTGGRQQEGGDFTGLGYADLCPGLPQSTLVLHDQLDNLVPIEQSERLLATCGGDAVYWPRAEAPDPGAPTHGPLLEEPLLPSVMTYAYTYLHRRLASESQILLGMVARPALLEHLTAVHGAQARGEPVEFAAPRLRELTDPRLYLFDLPAIELVTGAQLVAEVVNQVWSTDYTAEEIDETLAAGLPEP